MNKRLEIVVFLSGGVVMVLELVGSRVLAPYFGNSLFVWTGLIGVILGSMSLGYYYGGKLADKGGGMKTLSKLLFFASFFVLLTAFFKESILGGVMSFFRDDIRSGSLISIMILFAPASILLGCVSPYAASIKLTTKEKVGSVVGSLYALSTMGSIVGTFVAGYFLIPSFGNTNLLYMLSIILLMLSALTLSKISRKFFLLFMIIPIFYYINVGLGYFRIKALVDIDSLYNRILVMKGFMKGKETISLSVENRGSQSAVFTSSPETLVSDYTNAFRIGGLIHPNIKKALMLGGAGFTFPRFFIENNLGESIDVVEIDSKMVDLAKKYFFLKEDPRMKIHIVDARMFMNSTEEKYDIIFLDVFTSIIPPYHLTTIEFIGELKKHLTDEGILMVNLISSIGGVKSQFLNAEGNTLKKVFGKIDLFVIQQRPSSEAQNLILVAYMGERFEDIKSTDSMLSKMINDRYPLEDKISGNVVLTDDYAPVEYITRSLYGFN